MSSVNTFQPSPQEIAPLSKEAVARLCKALGHPARMAIIEILKTDNQCLCGRIVKQLPLAQSTVSQHLKYLKDCGLITGHVDHGARGYCLNRPLMAALQRSLSELLKF
ncbi:MAG: metalloregulator ArsR/SmtB family transcription factor [Desulfobacterales bacterium]|nr:metalloregulator ArsR/SmtB family transcription factor [Desulfobacterales bacterium]